jgi:flagellar motor protein MotB
MRKLAAWVLAAGMVFAPAVMAAHGSGDDKTSDSDAKKTSDASKTDTSKTDATKAKSDSTTPTSAELASELEQMRLLMKEQADQLEQQRQELAELKAALDRNSSTAASPAPAATNGSAAPAGTVAAPSTADPSAPAAPAPAPSVSSNTTPRVLLNNPQALNTSDHSPLSFKIGDAQFTPGGFMDFTIVGRSTTTGNGIGTTFNSIPVNTTNGTTFAGGVPELRFSNQNSRVALRVDAPVGGGQISGYVEADFLGLIAQNANVTSNSDSLRMRLYFGDYRIGKWEILAGQDWSMLTPNRKGINPFPNDIFYSQDMDTNYQVGLTWSRQPQFRVVYHPSDHWALGASIENPDAFALSSTTVAFPTAFTPLAGQVDQTSGGTLATPPTPGFLPDFIFKLANDETVGGKAFHWEAVGLLSSFRLFTPAAITTTTSQNNYREGGGASLNINLELFKNFHLIANSFVSDGGGRYLLGSGPDLIVKQLTTTSPFIPGLVHADSGIGGIEWQVAKPTMFTFYYGFDYFGRNVQVNPSTGLRTLGYGASNSANTTDSVNRVIQEPTIGWIQTFWQNPNYGKFSMITQASYENRDPWALLTGEPKNAHAFMAWVDLRYTLP